MYQTLSRGIEDSENGRMYSDEGLGNIKPVISM
jgi:hypothetical protein